MEKTPQFFTRTSKPPTAKDKDKPMTNEESTAKATDKEKQIKKRLSTEQGLRMIKEWDTKTVSGWAKEFGVSYQTISLMAKVLNKKKASVCPPKTAKPKKREDIADEWIALLEKEQGKK